MQSTFPPINHDSFVSFESTQIFAYSLQDNPITCPQKMAYWTVLLEIQMIRKINFLVDKSYHLLWRFTIEMKCDHVYTLVRSTKPGKVNRVVIRCQ